MSMTDSIYDVELYANSFLFTPEEYSSTKSKDKLPVRCSHCGETFYRKKDDIKRSIQKERTKFYCSKQCQATGRTINKHESQYTCKVCGKLFTNLPSKYASGNFCSRSCANKYSSIFANTKEKRIEKSDTIKSKHTNSSIVKNILSLYEKYNFAEMKNILNISSSRLKRIVQNYNIQTNNKFISPSKRRIIKVCKLILNKEESITKTDLDNVKNIIYQHIYNDNMTPKMIGEIYGFYNTGINIFLSKELGIKLKSLKEANISYHKRVGTYDKLSEKELYYKRARFSFGFYKYKNIKGYELIEQYGIYNPLTNKNGVSRDHMLSINYGWTHNIPPEIIAHPANCEIILQSKNASKSKKSSITFEELNKRINNWK